MASRFSVLARIMGQDESEVERHKFKVGLSHSFERPIWTSILRIHEMKEWTRQKRMRQHYLLVTQDILNNPLKP